MKKHEPPSIVPPHTLQHIHGNICISTYIYTYMQLSVHTCVHVHMLSTCRVAYRKLCTRYACANGRGTEVYADRKDHEDRVGCIGTLTSLFILCYQSVTLVQCIFLSHVHAIGKPITRIHVTCVGVLCGPHNQS